MRISLIILIFSMITIIHGERIIYYAQQKEETSSRYGVYRYIQDGPQVQKELLVSYETPLRAMVQISDRYLFYVDFNHAGVIDLKIKRKFQTWRNMGSRFFYDSREITIEKFSETAMYEKGSEIVIWCPCQGLKVFKPLSQVMEIEDFCKKLFDNKTFIQQEELLNSQNEKSSNRNLSSEINLNTPPNIPNENIPIDSTIIKNDSIILFKQNYLYSKSIRNQESYIFEQKNIKNCRCILQYEGLPVAISDDAIIRFFKRESTGVPSDKLSTSQETQINYGTIKNKGCFRIGTYAYFLSSQGMVQVDLTNLSSSILGGTQQDYTTLSTDEGVIINSYGYTPYEHIPIAKGKWVLLASVVNPRSNYSIQFASRSGVSTESFTHQTNQDRSEFSVHATISVKTPIIEGSATVAGHGKYMDEIKNIDSNLINSSEFRALTFKVNRGISQFIWRYEIEGSGMFDGYTLSTPHIHVTNTPTPPQNE